MGVRITVQSMWPESKASTFVYEFAQSRIVIGRSRSADVQLPHAAVSGTHASVRTQGAGYALVDEASTNGTRVNEVRLVPGRPKSLRSNDVIDLGGYRLAVEVGVPVAQAMSARLTADFARQMLGEQDGLEEDDLGARLSALQTAPDVHVELLPIAREDSVESKSASRSSRPSTARSSRPSSKPPGAEPVDFRPGELAVYALAALVVVSSVVAMALLMST